MEFVSAEGEARYAEVARAARPLVCLDFDGTLAPIVADPAAARIHPEAADALAGLAAAGATLAVVTGRPARQALELGALEILAERVAAAGSTLYVLGQYGNERWTSLDRRIVSPDAPPGLGEFRGRLPGLLAGVDAAGEPFVEDKGLAVAVHTRRMPDPAGSYERLLPVLSAAARDHGLDVEPGRLVVEVRAPGSDKGGAVRTLVIESRPDAVLFCGDDLGDVAAFEAIGALRADGLPGLLVCSGSAEQVALVELADVVVPGPDGVITFLQQYAADRAEAAGS